MRPLLAEMRRRHHGGQCRPDRPARIGQEGRDTGERLVILGVEHMEDRADQERMGCLFPMIALLQRTFRIDQYIGDVLNVPHLPLAFPHPEQRIVGGRVGVGGSNNNHDRSGRAGPPSIPSSLP